MNLFLKNSSFCKKVFLATFLSVFVFSFAVSVRAQATSTPEITNTPAPEITNASDAKNDFVLEPGKVEIFANPGESVDKSITITNRASSRVSFKVEVEDFIGSSDQDKPVVLLGSEKSPYSFKDNVIPEITTFSLESNGSIVIPVKINVPIDAQPGGFYTSVLVSNAPSVDSGAQSSEVEGTTKIVSRVGTLFFVRVNGVAKESGALDDLKVIYPTKDNPNLYKFNILFKNDGNVHLVPYGWITVTNTFGKMIGKFPVDAYFAMPKSIRYREVEWSAPFLFGRYTASSDINRGYGSDLIDTKTVTFWVIPWKIAVITLVIVLVIVLGLYLFFKKFKFVAKEEPPQSPQPQQQL